jgi:ubiquinone/menaquinone biosynthesis C-methylase UbiE
VHGIDIGCCEGSNTRQLVRRGARMLGIDVAPTFIRYAREAEAAEGLGIRYEISDAHVLPYADGSFDFATAFMSLMDIPEPDRAVAEAARVLKAGGFLQFSILHPCFVPPYRKTRRRADDSTRAIEIAGYFDRTDGQIDKWWFSTTPLPNAPRRRSSRCRAFIAH